MTIVDIAIAAASFGIAVIALGAAVMQVTMAVDIEARRKGKTDRIALGDWAVESPQLKLLLHLVLRVFRLNSPWGDPRVLSVPFITVGEMEKYLRAESAATRRRPLERRMATRLVESATNAIITGDGRYTGRMYAVRGTTRKRSEACWADAMDMCGMTRDHWFLMTGASAQACDGVVRPANAVTNLHSLWGFGRIMGLRRVEISGSRITMTNGGASLYLDTYAGVDRPTRLAHFSGSPNGRYMIVEEMSQQTAQSVYADAVWAAGNVPNPQMLNPGSSNRTVSRTRLQLPEKFPTVFNGTTCEPGYENEGIDPMWVGELLADMRANRAPGDGLVDLLEVVQSPVVVSCIRTYPFGRLRETQVSACFQALLWCIQHWWLSRYQRLSLRRYQENVNRPRLPSLGIGYIGPEFVTSMDQAQEWCAEAMKSLQTTTFVIDRQAWEDVTSFAQEKARDPRSIIALTTAQHSIVVKLMQCWKLMLLDDRRNLETNMQREKTPTAEAAFDATTATLAAVTMASIAIATDSTEIGSDEVNKTMEIELG